MARSRETKIELTAYDDLFQTDESREEAKLSKIRDIPISEIDEFPDHPFKVLMDEDMEQLVESIKRNGVMTPATVRLKEDGRYELISGHRRKKACELAGLETLKCEVKELTRDEAIIVMERLSDRFGDVESTDLASALMETAKNAVEDNLQDYFSQLKDCTKDSFLEELDDFNIEVIYRRLAANSVAFMLISRCGLDTNEFFDREDFADIVNFNTPATINAIGVATSNIAEMALREISQSIRNVQMAEKDQNRTFAQRTQAQYDKDRQQPERSEYDTIVELEERIEDAKLRKSSIEMETITLDNIYKLMLNFGKLYDIISDEEKKSLITYLIKEIQIYPNGESEQPLKSIEFNFPIYRDGQEVRRLLWEKGNTVETVVLLSKGEVDSKKIRVEFSLEDMDMSEFQDGATYTQIKDYVLEHSGLKVSNLYISQIKRKCGIGVGKNYNLPKSEDSRQPQCPPEKEKAIREAFKYFGII